MRFLWELDEKEKEKFINIGLGEYGRVIRSFSTLYSHIYTLEGSSKSLYIAKAPKIDSSQEIEKAYKQLRKFLNEINNIYSVCHHGLIHRFGYAKVICGVPFLVSAKRQMNLRDAIEEGAFSEVDAIVVAYQIVIALEYCAIKGIVCHQDLKPENIFLDKISDKFVLGKNGYPYKYLAYLGDLGIANAAIISNRPWGSRPYMPPEQYNKINDNNQLFEKTFSKVDIFALGVNLYEMLTGGIHPVGERTTDIWPTCEISKKWESERPWKRWANLEDKITDPDEIKNKNLLKLINDCLKSDFNQRLDLDLVKLRLSEELKKLSPSAFDTLNAYLEMIIEAEKINTQDGWPYMDELMNDLEYAFKDI